MQSSEESGKVSEGMESSFPASPYLRLKPSPTLSIPSHSLLCSWSWPAFLLAPVFQEDLLLQHRQVRRLCAHLAHRLSRSHALCLLTASRPVTHVWEARRHHTPCVIYITPQQPPPSTVARALHSFPGIRCAHPSPFQAHWKGWHLSQGLSGCQS